MQHVGAFSFQDLRHGHFLVAISPPALRPANLPPINTALLPFFRLSTNCHGNGCSPILLGSLCKWHLCLTVTGFKIILRAWRQVIKLNFQPVDHMNVANERWIKKESNGKRCMSPPPFVKTLHSQLVLPPSSSRDGRWDSQVEALCWEQKNNSAKAPSSMEFMSCSSTQGHCGTQTHHRDLLRFFIWSSTHNVLCRPPAYLLHMAEMPGSFGSQMYYLWAEPERLENNVQQNETCWPRLQHGQPLSQESQPDKQQAEDEISHGTKQSLGSEAIMWNKYMTASAIEGTIVPCDNTYYNLITVHRH